MPDFYQPDVNNDVDTSNLGNAFGGLNGNNMQNIMQMKSLQAMNKKGLDQPSGMFSANQMIQALRQAGMNPDYEQQYDPSAVNF